MSAPEVNKNSNNSGSSGSGSDSDSGGEESTHDLPVDLAAIFYSSLNEPKATTMDFSRDGNYFVSSHTDDAVRVIDVTSLSHTETIRAESVGIHIVRYTQSSNVVCVAPRYHLDGELHLLDVETAQLIGEMAYKYDTETHFSAASKLPVYSSLVQCPATDLLGAVVSNRGRLALFHPLISSAVATSPERSIAGNRASIAFAHDGRTIAVGDDKRITFYDRRMLLNVPLYTIESKDVFRESMPNARRCKGIDFNMDGRHALLSASSGEVVTYNWKEQVVECDYFHDDTRRHFVGTSEAIGARYVNPALSDSLVVQPTMTMTWGRHLLVYDGFTAAPAEPPKFDSDADEREGAAEATDADNVEEAKRRVAAKQRSIAPGLIKYLLQSRDSEVPVALAVNPRYSLVASGARSVAWWAFT